MFSIGQWKTIHCDPLASHKGLDSKDQIELTFDQSSKSRLIILRFIEVIFVLSRHLKCLYSFTYFIGISDTAYGKS